MKSILVLGAGLVARPLVHYLAAVENLRVTVASRTLSKAQALVRDLDRAEAVALDVADEQALERWIGQHDVVVSLLPATEHVRVARLCLKRRRHLATTSYVGEEMRALDGAAREAGLTFLNECGLDPGIDHMTAKRVIDDAVRRGARVVSFRSWCGGLPAPEANTNPIGYKFSWSPRSVLTAATQPARYLLDGELAEIPGSALFARPEVVEVPEIGRLEGYPNRDSLGYVELYDLGSPRTMFRGTLRTPGHCETWHPWVLLGLLDREPRSDLRGLTYRDFMSRLAHTEAEPEAAVQRRLGLTPDAPALRSLEWLGMFDDEPIPGNPRDHTDVLATRMAERCRYESDERDMIVLQHEFVIASRRGEERVRSSLVAFGEAGGDSAMARTVSLPVAIATRLIVQGAMTARGVVLPLRPEIYDPILDELETLGIRCEETVLA